MNDNELHSMAISQSGIYHLFGITWPNVVLKAVPHKPSFWPIDAIWRHRFLVNVGSDNSLLPDDMKSLPEPMLTYHT